MAKVRLILDTRSSSKSKTTGHYPVALRVFHRKVRLIPLNIGTVKNGWDKKNEQLKNSVDLNGHLDIQKENKRINKRLFDAKQLTNELGSNIELINADSLVTHIKSKWESRNTSEIKLKVENAISLQGWGNQLIARKMAADEPATARWFSDGINAILKFNNGNDILLHDISVTFLRNFEAHHIGKGNSKNTVGIYLRAIRNIYNAAIDEDVFKPTKNVFKSYKIPKHLRTKKRAISKEEMLSLHGLSYEHNSPMWHARNYALIMFYCRGMNFIDLVQIKVMAIAGNRLSYGRSKTGMPFSVRISDDLGKLLGHYLKDKELDDYLFPYNYDGSSKHFQKYVSQRRRMNERLRKIAVDAGIGAKLTTYTIRHTWATAAKYMGISTALISEGLGHRSIATTEIYLKDFHDKALDEMNDLVTGR